MRPCNAGGLFCALAVAGLATSAWAGGVRIVERPDVPPFTTIQAGVDAALAGETLLVGKGTYAGFSISAKPLSVIVSDTPSGVSSRTTRVPCRVFTFLRRPSSSNPNIASRLGV